MAVLRHETWRFGNHLSSGAASLAGDAFNARVSGTGQRTHVYYAATFEEAMQAHYDHQGWGPYTGAEPGVTDQPYADDLLAQQLLDYPDDAELRRLNGL